MTTTAASTQFVKDMSKTIDVMSKNKLPSCKKQTIPPLFMHIPYCQDARTKPNKTVVTKYTKDFYQACNMHNVFIECAAAKKMKHLIVQGRQVCSADERYASQCESINMFNTENCQRSHGDCKKKLQQKKNGKLKTLIANTKAEHHLSAKQMDNDDEEEEDKDDPKLLLPVLDCWDDEEEEDKKEDDPERLLPVLDCWDDEE